MKTISLETSDGRPVACEVCIADSFVARTIGLLRLRGLGAHQGVLLVPGGSIHTIGMRFAIDVVFLDRRMQVLDFAARVPPRRFRIAPPNTRHVLELAAGRIAEIGLLIGHYVLVAQGSNRDAAERTTVRSGPRAPVRAPCPRHPLQFSLRLPPPRCTRARPAPNIPVHSTRVPPAGGAL